MRKALRVGIVLAATSVLVPQFAAAQAPSSQPSAENVAEARKRYQLGLKLYEDGNYEAARIEFERAMSLAPSYKILYNVGLSYKQLNNYVDAMKALERYLAEGGPDIPADRRADVEKALAELRPRIARVKIGVSVVGAEVTIDGIGIGKSPLREAVLVNPGVRRFSAQAPGYLPVSKTLTIGTSERPEIKLDLEELPKEKIVDRSNPWTIPTVVGWSATGVAAIGTTIFGVLALNARSDQKSKLDQVGVSADDLNKARDKTDTLSGVADALLATTVVFAGVSTYFTLRMISAKPTEPEKEAPGTGKAFDFKVGDVKVGPTGVLATGTF